MIAFFIVSLALAAATTTPLLCRIDALPTASQAIVVCNGEQTELFLAGVHPPLGRTAAERSHAEALLAAAAPTWLGRPVAQIVRSPKGAQVLLDPHQDLALEILRAGLGWAADDRPELRDAERSARARRLGIWNLELWQQQRSLTAAPVLIPAPLPSSALRRGLAAHLQGRTSRSWQQRHEDFETALEELESTSDQSAQP